MTIGSDPKKVGTAIKQPSISPIHAQIRFTATGSAVLSDLGSENGTWVNYAPVSKKGTVLQHNDLVHIGKVAFRFELVEIQS
jgi:pSer/pThr/pTyr-binding forkhead associated (FHA) protein